jgi:YD repeat-containing protein
MGASMKDTTKKTDVSINWLRISISSIVASALFGIEAHSQTTSAPAPPSVSAVDESGFDLISRNVEQHVTDLNIGQVPFNLSHEIHSYGNIFIKSNVRDSLHGDLMQSGGTQFSVLGNTIYAACSYQFSFGSFGECFDLVSGVLTPRSRNGSTLVANADGTYTFSSNGVVSSISGFVPVNTPGYPAFGSTGVVTRVTYPTGYVIDINWLFLSGSLGRIQSVTNNAGYQVKYIYETNNIPNLNDSAALSSWQTVIKTTAINNKIEYCGAFTDTCALARPWKSATYSWISYFEPLAGQLYAGYSSNTTQFSITNQAGAIIRYTLFGNAIVGFKPPTSPTDVYAYTYCSPTGANALPYYHWCPGSISVGAYIDTPAATTTGAFVGGGIATIYKEGRPTRFTIQTGSSGNPSGLSFSSVSKIDPDGRNSSVGLSHWANQAIGTVPNSLTLPTASYTWSNNGLNTTGQFQNRIVSYSDGQSATYNYQYDARGNVTSVTRTPPAGSPATPIVTSATYPPTCTNQVICNKPTSISDAKSNVTQIVYDPVHGGILRSTEPAAPNGVSPQSRYTYAQISAQVLGASGTLSAASPIWVLTQESSCRTGPPSGAACAIANDEVRKNYQYGPASGLQDLLIHGTSVTADSITLRTCYTYDVYGNKLSETKPNAQLAACP